MLSLSETLENVIGEALEEMEIEWKMCPDLSQRNFYSRFDYATFDENEIIVEMSKDRFRSFEYYLGMEYEREHIKIMIELENKVYVVYEDCDRLISILNLDELEDEK